MNKERCRCKCSTRIVIEHSHLHCSLFMDHLTLLKAFKKERLHEPQAINSGKPALSLGCCGARAYLDVLTDDVALWALPGARIADYAARIKVLADANQILTKFHELRRED